MNIQITCKNEKHLKVIIGADGKAINFVRDKSLEELRKELGKMVFLYFDFWHNN